MGQRNDYFHIELRSIFSIATYVYNRFKDTHREKTATNKTPMLTKGMNMDIWVVGTSYQVFMRGFSTETNFQKNKVVTGRNPFFCDRSILYSPFYLS